MTDAVALPGAERLHRRALRLEWFTIGWNVVEAAVAVAAGLVAGSVALVGFGADSGIEVLSATFLVWRLRVARPGDDERLHRAAERRALYGVATTFFLLAAYIGIEAVGGLISGERPDAAPAGIALASLSLLIMPTLAYWKQRTGRQMGSRALQADAIETWVCSYLSLALLAGLGLNAAVGWWWADAAGALAMLPVIVWQGLETLEDARAAADPS